MSGMTLTTFSNPGKPRGARFAGPVALLLALLAAGCASPVADTLRSAADAGSVPPGLVLVWDDHDPKWGGHRITVRGGGEVEVRGWRPGTPQAEPEVWTGQVAEAEIADLVDLLVRIEAWEQRVDDEFTPLDEARATLTLRIDGARERVWEWANDLEANQRLILVENRLEALVRAARSGAASDRSVPPSSEP
ncbi:MAG: hypothetical protein ACOCUS_02450 [Polyangiales bacterium]